MGARFEFMCVALQHWEGAESESANERIRTLWFCLVEGFLTICFSFFLVLFLFVCFFLLLVERKV